MRQKEFYFLLDVTLFSQGVDCSQNFVVRGTVDADVGKEFHKFFEKHGWKHARLKVSDDLRLRIVIGLIQNLHGIRAVIKDGEVKEVMNLLLLESVVTAFQ